jgi:C_GCAxxG_C_C family probable redox protein
MQDRIVNAVNLFRSGFNCAQAVFASFCEQYGIDREKGLRLCCGLGGGVRSGEICGAVSGAVLVIGLKYGHADSADTESKSFCYTKTVEFIRLFKEKTGSVVCRELLGYDISTEDGMKQAQEKGLFKTRCVDMVRISAEILSDLGY